MTVDLMAALKASIAKAQADHCTCLSADQRTQMINRGEVMQSRPPCPVHGAPDLSTVPLIDRSGRTT